MSRVKDVVDVIETVAPSTIQETWDNSGLLIGFEDKTISRALICLDVTREVYEEALGFDAGLIICHHPIIFGNINGLNYKDPGNALIMDIIKSGISVYCCHTPFDKIKGGNNDKIAELLNLSAVKNLEGESVRAINKIFEKYDEGDLGRIGKLKESMKLEEAILFIAQELSVSLRKINVIGNLEADIKNVAICAGSGGDMVDVAYNSGCQLLITGDVKYHQAMRARELGLSILDVGHYNTEKFFSENMQEKLEAKMKKDVVFIASAINVEPYVMM